MRKDLIPFHWRLPAFFKPNPPRSRGIVDGGFIAALFAIALLPAFLMGIFYIAGRHDAASSLSGVVLSSPNYIPVYTPSSSSRYEEIMNRDNYNFQQEMNRQSDYYNNFNKQQSDFYNNLNRYRPLLKKTTQELPVGHQ